MKTYLELVKATFKNLFRDRMSLFWFLAFPVLIILLFGMIFSSDIDASDFPVGVVAGDGAAADALTSTLEQTEAFTVHTGSEEDELAALESGYRHLVIVLPPEADNLLARKQRVDVIFYYDQQHQDVNRVLISSISEILHEIERNITGQPRIFAFRSEAIQSSELRHIDFLLPGILAMALMQLGLFGSLQLVGLRERKVLRQLNVTPLPRSLFIGSEVTVRLFMALVQAMLLLIIGHFVFGVEVSGSWPALFGLILLGSAVFVSLGYLLVSFARSEDSGIGIIQMVQFPMMFLSGIFFPVEAMPEFIKPVVKAMPLTYLGDILRQVITGWAPMHTPGTNLLVLGGWLVASLLLAIKFFRWE